MAFHVRASVPVFLLLVLASQWAGLHARSMPGDYDAAEYVDATAGFRDPQDPAASVDTPTFTETFATQGSLDAPDSGYDYDSFASTDPADPSDEGVFLDSPETVQADTTSNGFPRPDDQVVFTQAQYDNDEVFFDTSSADTIYKANDG